MASHGAARVPPGRVACAAWAARDTAWATRTELLPVYCLGGFWTAEVRRAGAAPIARANRDAWPAEIGRAVREQPA